MLGRTCAGIVLVVDAGLLAFLVGSILTLSAGLVAASALYYVPALVLLTRAGLVGLRLDDEGALVMNPIRTIRVPWEKIERFELVPADGKTWLVRTDRTRVLIWAVQEWTWASTFGWKDTPERRWVEEWNALLAKNRAIAGVGRP